jgi:hypothetical protein
MNVHPKVQAATAGGTAGGALAIVILYLISQIPYVATWPASVQEALGVLVTALISGVSAFVAGYMKKGNTLPLD